MNSHAAAQHERRRLELVELRRAEILRAAGSLFCTQGYHQTAVADIAREIGIGHSAFYRYFKNKRDMLDALVEQAMADVFTLLGAEQAPEAATTLAEYRAQVGEITDRLWHLLDRSPVLRLGLFQADAVDPEFAERVTLAVDTVVAIIDGYLENGVARGFLRPGLDTATTARALLGLILGGLALERSTSKPAARAAYTEAAIALMFDGIAGASAENRGPRLSP